MTLMLVYVSSFVFHCLPFLQLDVAIVDVIHHSSFIC